MKFTAFCLLLAVAGNDSISLLSVESAPSLTSGPEAHGRPRLAEYTNSGVDPKNQYNACGQAAVATVLAALKVRPPDPGLIKEVYSRYPPNVLGGRLGTGPGRIQDALTGYGVRWRWAQGEAELKKTLDAGGIAVLLVDTGKAKSEGWSGPGLHWTVAFAYDDGGVYLSNWPKKECSWANLRRAWDSALTRVVLGVPPWKSHPAFLVPERG